MYLDTEIGMLASTYKTRLVVRFQLLLELAVKLKINDFAVIRYVYTGREAKVGNLRKWSPRHLLQPFASF